MTAIVIIGGSVTLKKPRAFRGQMTAPTTIPDSKRRSGLATAMDGGSAGNAGAFTG
jgi:hypothetical protein